MRRVAVLTACFCAVLTASGLLEAHQSGLEEWPHGARAGVIDPLLEPEDLVSAGEIADGEDDSGVRAEDQREDLESAALEGQGGPGAAASSHKARVAFRDQNTLVTTDDLTLSTLLPTTDPDLEPHVQNALKFYSKRARPGVQQALQRRAELAPMVMKAFADAGIPLWLANIAIVESHFNPRARSSAGPAGMWQLQAPTARSMGLRVNRQVDERFDPEKSTQAVVKLLIHHYREFNDWELALAAYSAGGMRVQHAVEASPHADLTGLVRKGLLPSRVLENVAAVHAASRIAAQPEEHGFRRVGRDVTADLMAETRRAMEAMGGQESTEN